MALAALLAAPWAAPAAAKEGEAPLLWQERYFFDALLQARDRLARTQSDPALIPVLKAIAAQASQQVLNLQQIHSHVKVQQDNLRYAFSQADPELSLETIQANFETLSQGTRQVRSNLYYLTARCRIASSQALPDPEMYQNGLLILGQIQQLQLGLNTLYLNTVEARRIVLENGWATDKAFRHQTELLLRSVVHIQDAVFSVYNAGYEFTLRSR
jgi:hypothetical protein